MGDLLVAFFINNYMVTVLIILNIILIVILLTIVILYLFKNKKDDIKNVCVNDDVCEECEEIKSGNHKQKNNKKEERVFEGRFITDDEYHQIKNSRRSEISILLEELNIEYEHLKEISK